MLMEFGIWNLEFGIWNFGFCGWLKISFILLQVNRKCLPLHTFIFESVFH